MKLNLNKNIKVVRDQYATLPQLLADLGISQHEFSRAIGHSRSYTSDIVNKGAKPSLESAIMMAAVLRIPLDTLVRLLGYRVIR